MKPCESIVSSFVHQAAVSCMILRKLKKRPPNKHSGKKKQMVQVSIGESLFTVFASLANKQFSF